MPKKSFLSVSDYFSRESGSIKKKWRGKLAAALIFPNKYNVGMSNLGFQIVYELLNQHPDIVCERVFFQSQNSQPLSIESQRPLSDFSILFTSLSFEDDYVNFIRILLLSGIQAHAELRIEQPDTPVIIGGGVAVSINPEPLSSFIDAFVVGEAEVVLPSLFSSFLNYQSSNKKEFLSEIARKESVYVPSFYSYQQEIGWQRNKESVSLPVKKAYLKELPAEKSIGFSKIISPDTEFADMFLAELGRGCSRGCRFCAAGYVYRPPRLWPAEQVLNAVSKMSEQCKRVGLLGMEMAEPDDLKKISSFLLHNGCSLSFSSLRADNITSLLVELLKKSRIKTITLAPDGASERLRRVINKCISEDDILEAVERLTSSGVGVIKLYFMIGLPSESIDDLEEMVSLVKLVKKRILKIGRPLGRIADIHLSVNCFVPKPMTPFQFFPFAGVKNLNRKLKFLRKQFSGLSNVRMISQRPDKSYFQAVVAKGDRAIGTALYELALKGGSWKKIFKDSGLNPEFYAMKKLKYEDNLCWDILDIGIKKSYFWEEYQRALKEKETSPCNTDSSCKKCGVC
jgi:radical SAM superfamily enzyme YgiQ (UPF0313 family)